LSFKMLNSFRITLASILVFAIWYFASPAADIERVRRAAVTTSASTCNKQGSLAMTISDTPTSAYIASLVATVVNSNVVATWFVTTSNIRVNDNLRATFVNSVKANSLQLGLTYPQSTSAQSYAEIQAVLASESAYMNSIFGAYPLAVRFPAGSDSSTAIKAATDMGLYTVQYAIDTLLSSAASMNASSNVEANMNIAFESASPSKGSFIVMHHDATTYASQVVPNMVQYARSLNYTWVPLSDCLGASTLSSSVAPTTSTNTTSAASGSLPTDVFPANWSFAVFFAALMLFGSW